METTITLKEKGWSDKWETHEKQGYILLQGVFEILHCEQVWGAKGYSGHGVSCAGM
jgi:hypothetical protein